MRNYARKFFLITTFGFVSIFGWTLYTAITSHWTDTSVTRVNTEPRLLIDHYSTSTAVIESFSKNEIHVKNKQKFGSKSITANEDTVHEFSKLKNIPCNINGEYKVNCVKIVSNKEASIYIPFNFIHKYFEINGKIVRSNKNQEIFEWNHSYSKIFYPDQPYDSIGKFLWFENYNVEIRERVKCISAIEGVPISTQWFAKGHFYPTQISQYGLSHFSKNISEPAPQKISLIANFSLSTRSEKSGHDLSAGNATILSVKDVGSNFLVVHVDLRIKKLKSYISFFVVDINNGQNNFCVKYVPTNITLQLNGSNKKMVKYGIGSQTIGSGWFTITRDLFVDLLKANLIADRKRTNYRLTRIEYGEPNVEIRQLEMLNSAHDYFAKAAGDWLVRKQNLLGGWDIKVKRRLPRTSIILNEGWHSSMAQGQAMSLLTRLYTVTGEVRYLRAAQRATQLFDVEAFKDGVKATLFDKYVWYEEYPTVPSVFVLNGFIYSLFGLYDLSKICDDHPSCRRASQLFDDGIRSLEAMLPLFDSGSGSFYDLRHLSLGNTPNLARWDYHSTHINQLLHLHTIVRRDLLQTTAQRWIGYMSGHRAAHN